MLLGCFKGRAAGPSGRSSTAIRVVGLDGRVRLYEGRVKASEVMEEQKCHLLCRSDRFLIGQKVPPLSAADDLQPGHSYFILPSHFFQSALSFVTVASSLTGGSLRHFDIHLAEKGKLQIRIGEPPEKTGAPRPGVVCTTSALEKEYHQLVASKHWKPTLETIAEPPNRRRPRLSHFRLSIAQCPPRIL